MVTIKGRSIIVTNHSTHSVFPVGVVEDGKLMWHALSKSWIIGQEASDLDTDEIGGCSGGPAVVDLANKVYWSC